MPREKLIRFRRDLATPGNGDLESGEPFFDLNTARSRLLIGNALGDAVVLADPVYIAQLEARIRLLEQALRELQYTAWTGTPTYPIPP